jgi:2-C-methyl-D-erythritol 4-phosphate cytidylyltransferase
MNRVIVTAAGQGTRFGGKKTLHLLKGKPLLAWAIANFERSEKISEVIVTYPAQDSSSAYESICAAENFRKVRFVRGAETRFESVRNAFESFGSMDGFVLIHDAARPLISAGLINRVLQALEEHDAVIPVLPVQETVKQVEEARVMRTLPRETLYFSQTPQGFRSEILKNAYSKVQGQSVTDEAMIVEMAGYIVQTVEGDPKNIKITTAIDVSVAESIV